MGKRRQPVMSFGDAFKLTNGLATSLMQSGMNKEVAEAMASKATETIGGDYQKEMGLNAAPEQAEHLKAQDADFGKDGASVTADALNSNAADKTPASAQGLTTRYKMLGAESDKPFTADQTDDLRMSKVADIYAKNGLLDKSTTIRDKLRENRRQTATDERATEEYGWKKEDRATKVTDLARDNAVKQGLSRVVTDNLAAQDGSKNAAAYQGDLAGLVEGKGLDATIRAEATKNGATPDETDAAVAAYRGSMDDATAQHNAAGMDKMNKQFASIYAGIGNDPDKAMKFLQMAEAEGAPKLIAALKDGKVDIANQLWNGQGNSKGDIVKSVGPNPKTGDTMAEVVNAYSGKKRFVNVSVMERALMSAADIAKLRETESKIGENDAQRVSALANAGQSNASAGKSRAETVGINLDTEITRKTGEKPRSGGEKTNLQFTEVRAALGDVTQVKNPLTGKMESTVVPNPAREAEFFQALDASGEKNVEKFLVKHLAKPKPAAAAKPAKTDPNYRPWK